MYIFTSANTCVNPVKTYRLFQFFKAKYSLVKAKKGHKFSGSYLKLFRNNLNLNLPQAKLTQQV